MKTKIQTILKSIFILALFTLAISAGAVWVIPPAGTPPANNIPSPINSGGDPQSKVGAFAAGGLRSFGLGLFDGQVGIGTLTPAQPLDVVGNVKFTGALMPGGNAGGSGQFLTSSGGGAPTWTTITGGGNVLGGGSGTANYVTKWTNNNTIGNSQIFDNATNVGIGTASPGAKLDVAGTAKMTGFQLTTGATSSYVLTSDGSGVGTWQAVGGGSGGGWTDDGTTVRLTTVGNTPAADHVRIGDGTIIYKGTSTVDANRFFYAPGSPGFFNMFIGKGAGKITCNDTNCHSNVGIGEDSLKSISAGWYNIGIGHLTLGSNTSGYDNIAIGDLTMTNNTTGFKNVAIGGGNAGPTSNALFNTISLGFGATTDVSNKVRIGNTNISFIGGQVAWSPASDARYKKNIKDIDLGLDFINSLRPVSYKMKTDADSDGLSYGLIAQEVEKALEGRNTKMISRDSSPEGMMSLRYNDLMAPMIKAIQEQQKEIEDLKAEIEILKSK